MIYLFQKGKNLLKLIKIYKNLFYKWSISGQIGMTVKINKN